MPFQIRSFDQLFPTPLIRFAVDGADALNRALKKEIAERRRHEPGIERSNRGGWHSERDFFVRTEPAHRDLAMELLRMMAEAARTVDPDADYAKARLVPDGWVNVNPPGAMNAPHTHPDWFWSGCYYVDLPTDGGMIEFLSPIHPLPSGGVIGGPLTHNRVAVQPKPGEVLIFPATMAHWVHVNRAKSDRISIAFNGKFERKG